MMQPSDNPHKNQNILIQIYEGMRVFDPEGETIGTVQRVYFGALTPEEDARGQGPVTAPDPGEEESTLIEDFLKSLSPQSTLSESQRQQLLRHGFIRINTTEFMNEGCYATPEQIAKVSGNDIALSVSRDELMKC